MLINEIVSRDYYGFGDNIYKRVFVKELAKRYKVVYLYTSFPELFSDIPNIKFCKPVTQLKTQAKHIAIHEAKGTYCSCPSNNIIKLNYGHNFKKGLSVIESFESVIPLTDFNFDLPDIVEGKSTAQKVYDSIPKDKKLCIIRLPSIRHEWRCETRNPLMKHFVTLMEAYKDKFYFLSIGDIDDNEQFSDVPPSALIDFKYHNKELGLYETLNLIKLADCTISIPCFVLPYAISAKVPAFFIYGGYVKHELLVDKRMDLSKIGHIAPNPFCNCLINVHNCNKKIENHALLNAFDTYLQNNKILTA